MTCVVIAQVVQCHYTTPTFLHVSPLEIPNCEYYCQQNIKQLVIPMHSTCLVSLEDEFVRFVARRRVASQCTTRQKQTHLQILHMTTFEFMEISNSSQDIKSGRITF